jgi:HPt (histidine-containing phosphotransfer) domain-containing protein
MPRVIVEKRMQPLMPAFLARLARDLVSLRKALAQGDYAQAGHLGHKLAGVGGGYGLWEASRLGKMIKAAAEARDGGSLRQCTQSLAEYLESLEIDYA